jgi:hypothetical protein
VADDAGVERRRGGGYVGHRRDRTRLPRKTTMSWDTVLVVIVGLAGGYVLSGIISSAVEPIVKKIQERRRRR